MTTGISEDWGERSSIRGSFLHTKVNPASLVDPKSCQRLPVSVSRDRDRAPVDRVAQATPTSLLLFPGATRPA